MKPKFTRKYVSIVAAVVMLFVGVGLWVRNGMAQSVSGIHPMLVLVAVLPLCVIWLCVLGNALSVFDPGELGACHMILFNDSLDVLIATALVYLLRVEIDRAIGELCVYGKFRMKL